MSKDVQFLRTSIVLAPVMSPALVRKAVGEHSAVGEALLPSRSMGGGPRGGAQGLPSPFCTRQKPVTDFSFSRPLLAMLLGEGGRQSEPPGPSGQR